MLGDLTGVFRQADMAAALRAVDRHFSGNGYSLKSLFRDEQRRILRQIMGNVLREAEASYRGLYDSHAPLMHFLAEVHMPLPGVLRRTAEFVLNSSLRREFEAEELDLDRITSLLDSARREGITLDAAGLAYAVRQRLDRMMQDLAAAPRDFARLQQMEAAVRLARSFSFEIDLWRVQNRYWHLLQSVYPEVLAAGDPESERWVEHFAALGRNLGIKLESRTEEAPVAA
jgi:hypothetical protein